MLKKLTLIAAFGLFVIPATVSAQDLPQAEAATGGQGQGGNVQYKEETVYDFDGDDVTGNLVKPNGEGVRGEVHGKTSSLIKIRSDFVPELLKTVEEL